VGEEGRVEVNPEPARARPVDPAGEALLLSRRGEELEGISDAGLATIDAVEARATMGEIVEALEGIFGRYREEAAF